MKITLKQVLADIAEGKSTQVYYSARTLWWTHLSSDVDEATKKGNEIVESRFQQRMDDPLYPQAEKDKLTALHKMSKDLKHQIPTDPSGSPLYQIDAKQWVEEAIAKPEHFGLFGLDAFMKAHHQNHENQIFAKWKIVNKQIDTDNGTISDITHVNARTVEGEHLLVAIGMLSTLQPEKTFFEILSELKNGVLGGREKSEQMFHNIAKALITKNNPDVN